MPAPAPHSIEKKPIEGSPVAIVAALLAMGVIRLLNSDKRLDNRTEESVSTVVSSTQEENRE